MSQGLMLIIIGAFIVGHAVWGDWAKRAWEQVA
jgi:hypothetical protein